MATQEYDDVLRRQHAVDLGVAGSDAALTKDSEFAQKLADQDRKRQAGCRRRCRRRRRRRCRRCRASSSSLVLS